jgi:hypothetical protein
VAYILVSPSVRRGDVVKSVNERTVACVGDVLQEVGLEVGAALVFGIERRSKDSENAKDLSITVRSQ